MIFIDATQHSAVTNISESRLTGSDLQMTLLNMSHAKRSEVVYFCIVPVHENKCSIIVKKTFVQLVVLLKILFYIVKHFPLKQNKYTTVNIFQNSQFWGLFAKCNYMRIS